MQTATSFQKISLYAVVFLCIGPCAVMPDGNYSWVPVTVSNDDPPGAMVAIVPAFLVWLDGLGLEQAVGRDGNSSNGMATEIAGMVEGEELQFLWSLLVCECVTHHAKQLNKSTEHNKQLLFCQILDMHPCDVVICNLWTGAVCKLHCGAISAICKFLI